MKEKNQIIALVGLIVVAAMVWFWNTHQSPTSLGSGSIAVYTPMTVESAVPAGKSDASKRS